MKKDLLKKLKVQLEQEQASLRKELEGVAREDKKIPHNWDATYPKEPDSDMEEEADETQEYENRISLEENMETRLKSVDLALEKMKQGTYGTCEKCGKEIEEKRLLAYPEARFCIEHNK